MVLREKRHPIMQPWQQVKSGPTVARMQCTILSAALRTCHVRHPCIGDGQLTAESGDDITLGRHLLPRLRQRLPGVKDRQRESGSNPVSDE